MPVSASAQDSDGESGIQEIIVTAQRREQSLQDVPISISALNEDMITANRVQDMRDLNAVAPNLTVRQSGGASSQAVLSMRGIVTGGVAAGSDKGISMYLDGVYLQPTQGSVFELAAIERIEVLKGPQGTLFGRNATGGAISVWTHNPTGEFGVHQEFTYGNLEQKRSKTILDLPKFGPLSISGTYLHSEQRGDTRNLGAGTVWDFSSAPGRGPGIYASPRYLGNKNIESVQVAVDFDLMDNLDLMYKFDWTDQDFTPNGAGLALLNGTLALTYPNGANRTPVSLERQDAVNNAFVNVARLRGSGHNLTAELQLSDSIKIKNILGYRRTRVAGNAQLDGMGGFSLQGAPFVAIIAAGANLQRQWSDEFQVIIDNQWFNLTAGYLHFQDKQTAGGNAGIPNTLSAAALQGAGTAANPFKLPVANGYLPTEVKSVSDAVYAQLELNLTDRIHAVGGMRITKDRKTGIEYSWLQPRPQTGNVNRTQSGIVDYRGTKATYLAGLNFYPTDDILAYAKYSTGYISGGQIATIAFGPETAKSWEAGVKADLFDRRFRTNLAVFDVDYKNIGVTTSGLNTGVPSAAPFAVAVVASGDAHAYGFEWENTLLPFEGLTLTGNLGYTHFKYDKDSIFPGFVAVSGSPGYQVASRPRWTANVSAQYETPEIIAGGRLVLRADANYRSRTLLATDLTFSNNATDPEDPAIRKAATVPATWVANGRIALKDMDIAGAKATVAVWGRNLFDDKSINAYVGIGLGPLGYFASAIYERARTFGVDLIFDF
ncbi:MAG: TonB-dependent receptor [Novosphingobium sp.]|nr:TonB-dependent receptor [Novosphingobium sp.]